MKPTHDKHETKRKGLGGGGQCNNERTRPKHNRHEMKRKGMGRGGASQH
jgi:hypothetical protein